MLAVDQKRSSLPAGRFPLALGAEFISVSGLVSNPSNLQDDGLELSVNFIFI